MGKFAISLVESYIIKNLIIVIRIINLGKPIKWNFDDVILNQSNDKFPHS